MNWLQWVADNKEWIFSGIGVAAISAVLAFFLRKKRPESAPTQQAGDQSINQQGTGNTLNINLNQPQDKKKDQKST